LSTSGRLAPLAVSEIVGALLARDPDDRPASASEVLAQLRAVYGQAGTGALAAGERRGWLTPPLVATALLAAVIAVGLWWQPRQTKDSAGPPVVAVLPLTSISGDSSKDFVAAGIAESLISSLATLPSVTVLSRASVTEARGRSSDRSTLAKDLGATYFVEGSVQESGGRLLVTLNLVRSDQSVAWGDQMEGRLEEIFDLQSRLAAALSNALDVRVSPEVRQRMNARATASPEALTAYWQGRALLERRDVKGNLEAATAAFSKALTLDPRFALAHAALGEAYWHQYVETRDPVWAQRATDEGLTALRLDANEPAVRYTLAVTLTGRSE